MILLKITQFEPNLTKLVQTQFLVPKYLPSMTTKQKRRESDQKCFGTFDLRWKRACKGARFSGMLVGHGIANRQKTNAETAAIGTRNSSQFSFSNGANECGQSAKPTWIFTPKCRYLRLKLQKPSWLDARYASSIQTSRHALYGVAHEN